MVSAADILNARILVVDDKEANVRLIEGMLRVAGYTSVDSTTDPDKVCELHLQNRYGLILLDLQMPGMDGFQVMEGLKAIEADGYLPVLVITAQPAHKLRALEAGAKDFVSKPFDLAELRARVRNILEVRLLHLRNRSYSQRLEQTVRELEASREVIRLKDLEERKKREQELALAQETQESLLPRVVPQFEGFRIHAFSHPTRYVGGDFYDFQAARTLREAVDGSSGGRLRQGNARRAAQLHGAGRSQYRIPFGDSTAGSVEPDQPAAVREISSLPVRDTFSIPVEPGRRGTIHQRGAQSSLSVPLRDGEN